MLSPETKRGPEVGTQAVKNGANHAQNNAEEVPMGVIAHAI